MSAVLRPLARFVFTGAALLGLAGLVPPGAILAQSSARSVKARLLAGESLDPQLLAAVAEHRARTVELAAARAEAGLPAREPGSDIVPGLLVARFAGDAAPTWVASLAARLGATRVSRPRWGDFTVLHVDPTADPRALAAELAAQPDVVYAEPAVRRYSLYRPNDEFYDLQWNLEKLDLERAWDINRGGRSDVIVAVIDSGIAYTTQGAFHQAPDLAGTTFVPGFDFLWEDDMPVDLEGHGTHVTGTIAQTTNNDEGVAGIAFGVSIMPLKAITGELDIVLGAPVLGTSAVVAEAIRFAVDNGARVINMSLGGDTASAVEREAVEYAVNRGAVVVIAAGNDGDRGSPPSYPAAYADEIQGAIAVAALDYNLERSYYSNVNDYVEISAPGGDTNVDLNGDGYADGVLQQTLDADVVFGEGRWDTFVYQFNQGTSMAAPHVAAMAALLIDQGITDPAAVEAALAHFATDLGPAGRDDETGHGMINPRATLRGLGLAR
jgi:serine protease